MELQNRKINFLGDSITEGARASRPELCYVSLLASRLGLGAARNYGISGTRLARQQTPSANPRYDLDFCGRFREMDADADIVFVFGGTNDHGHGDAPMGSDADRTPETFIGACHYLYAGLKEKFPNATIVIATPLHRAVEVKPDGRVLSDYVNQIRRIAPLYGHTLLDLHEISRIKAHIPAIAAELTTDGLHPNDLGHSILADEIADFLKSL